MSPSRDCQHTVRAHGQLQVTCNDRAHAHGQQHITRTYRLCVRTVSNTVHFRTFMGLFTTVFIIQISATSYSSINQFTVGSVKPRRYLGFSLYLDTGSISRSFIIQWRSAGPRRYLGINITLITGLLAGPFAVCDFHYDRWCHAVTLA